MPANLSEVNGRVAAAFNTERGMPWHKLGQHLDKDMTIDQALEMAMVGEEVVRQKDLWVVKDSATTARFTVKGEEEPWVRVSDLEKVDGEIAVGINSTVFGTMSTATKSYHPTQRKELLQIAYDITGLAEGDAHVDTIGNLGKRGELFFAYVRVPQIIIDPQGVCDEIEHGLMLVTSFDQTYANTLGYGTVRPVCANTVKVGLGSLQQVIKAKHTKNSEARIREAALALDYAGAVEAELVKRAEAMLKVDGQKALETVKDRFYPIEKGMTQNAVTTRRRARGMIQRLYDGANNTASSLLGDNGWAAYQAFIEYKDHYSDVKGNGHVRELTRARNALLPGKVTNDKITASELILALAA